MFFNGKNRSHAFTVIGTLAVLLFMCGLVYASSSEAPAAGHKVHDNAVVSGGEAHDAHGGGHGAHDSGKKLEDLLYRTICFALMVMVLFIVMKKVPIKAMAHITGGGLPENLPRVLPKGIGARIDGKSWTRPEIFAWLQEQGNIEDREMYRTFNCGLGMVLVVDADKAEQCIAELIGLGEKAWLIGETVGGSDEVELI